MTGVRHNPFMCPCLCFLSPNAACLSSVSPVRFTDAQRVFVKFGDQVRRIDPVGFVFADFVQLQRQIIVPDADRAFHIHSCFSSVSDLPPESCLKTWMRAGGGEAGDDADGDGGEGVGRRKIGDNKRACGAENAAERAADDRQPLAVQLRGLDRLRGQRADHRDRSHGRDAVKIHCMCSFPFNPYAGARFPALSGNPSGCA